MAEYLCEEDMNTGEYISRDLALRQLNATCLATDCDNYNGVRCRACAYADAMDFIDAIPAADVQPVVHAYWIELPKALNPNENPCKCSNCGHILSFMNGYPKSKYCDECGAKMDIIYEDDKVRAIKVTGWDNDARNLTDEETEVKTTE